MMIDNLLQTFVILAAAFILTVFLTGCVKDFLLKRAMLDTPNERSSHTIPVPRGGGWGLLPVMLLALIGAAVFVDADLRHVGLIGGVVVLAAISWLDDRGHVRPAARLSLHIVAACAGSMAFTPAQFLFGGLLPYWADRAVMIVGWAWFINLYNFMDGIDGITAFETGFIAVGVHLVMISGFFLDGFTSVLTAALVGVSVGFYVHNRHPAKIFLGDVGSVPLGYLTGFCLISLAVNHPPNSGHLAAAFILPLYYLADSGITIGKRALRGEKIWQAHRQHFYQRAALGAGSHSKATDAIVDANVWLLLAAIVSLLYPWACVAFSIVIVAVLLRKLHKMAITPTA